MLAAGYASPSVPPGFVEVVLRNRGLPKPRTWNVPLFRTGWHPVLTISEVAAARGDYQDPVPWNGPSGLLVVLKRGLARLLGLRVPSRPPSI
jgi:hypothetical protein